MSHTRPEIKNSVFEILKVSIRLGMTSFGGPIAHLGYFRSEYVERRKWLDDKSYADLVALCQFLPGPASSQVGIGIGLMRRGLLGAITAWIGFTLPSAVLLVLFAYLFREYNIGSSGWINGLKVVAVAIVAQAVLGMGKNLAPDRSRATIVLISAVVSLMLPYPWIQVLLITLIGVLGALVYKSEEVKSEAHIHTGISSKTAAISLFLFFVLLVALPVLSSIYAYKWLQVIDSFYRTGSLVFGGGHVVLPLLENEVVSTGLVTQDEFLAGYGAAQAVPGPLFTFSSYLGAVMFGWSGALLATLAIFLPSFLLVIGVMPFWNKLRKNPKIQGALNYVNASVVGILLAALYNPVWTKAIKSPFDFCLALISFGMLVFWKLPPWVVVALSAIVGAVGNVYSH